MKTAKRKVLTGTSVTVPSSSEADSSSWSVVDNKDGGDKHSRSDTSTQAVLSVISHLEHSLDEERKQKCQLEAEMTLLREQQAKREMELRSSYDAELLRLQSAITRFQNSRSSTDQPLRPVTPSRSSSNPSPRLPTAGSATRQPRYVSHTGKENDEVIPLKLEIERQDELIAGFQRENERLYAELKQYKKEYQPSREILETAERLTSENATLRIEIGRLEQESRQRAKRIEGLLQMDHHRDQKERNSARLELHNAEREVRYFLHVHQLHLRIFSATVSALDNSKQLHKLRSKHKQLVETLESERCDNRVEREKMQEIHHDTVEGLRHKLQWYLENQSMVNRDQAKLQNQAKEISKLKEQLGQVQSQSETKDRPTCAFEESGQISGEYYHGSDPIILQHRIKSLEVELEQAQEHEKRAIRTIQQQYETVKHQYEERIKALSENQSEERIRAVKQSVEIQTTDNDSSQNLSSPVSHLRWQTPKIFNLEESHTVHFLLSKLRNQIGNLKHELADRQRTIDEFQRLSSLNSVTSRETQSTQGIMRYTESNQTTFPSRGSVRANPSFHRIRPRQINAVTRR
ncbi:hypothetical protein FBUS_08689 [Fasciolopsis buskii]|uniref:Centrosomal protein of 162 kDa n=1 Tax=Fasciolopsis buskii TaxID=27845 RepID=A0A8E0RNP7_9TREM|nr:hypothetical protein FBUS_08689 [Fasciolopsis buski]